MAIQLVNLHINRVIIHQVFERSITGEQNDPKCSSEFTVLDGHGLSALQSRIIEATGNDSHSIQMYISESGPGSTYDYCTKLIAADDDGFITVSREIAEKLTRSQSSRNIPGGILVIFDGNIGHQNNNVIGFIKAELHEGFALPSSDDLLLTFISKLLLTPTQRLYKVGLFVETESTTDPNQRTPDSFEVLVYDHNLMTRTESRQAAKYFYETFLGCSFSPSDKKLTSDFYYHTREYIDELPVESQDKQDLHNSLYSYLKVSQFNTVEISGFANEYLPPEFRDSYRETMVEKNVPEHAISKDLEYLKYKLRRRQIFFTSKVKIIAPQEGFDDLVEIREQEDDKTIVAIKGTIQKTE